MIKIIKVYEYIYNVQHVKGLEKPGGEVVKDLEEASRNVRLLWKNVGFPGFMVKNGGCWEVYG